jgi:DNA modification methylase
MNPLLLLAEDVMPRKPEVRCDLRVGDNLDHMRTLADKSVHLVVTSPPYDDLRTYGGYSWNFEALVPEILRVLVPGGLVVWIVNDEKKKGSESGSSFRQALFFIQQGFKLHDTMIWQKPNFSHPSSNSYHQVFEYMFVFSKGRPRCFNPIRDRKNLYAGRSPLGKNTVSNRDGSKGLRPVNTIAEFGQRHNVWLMNTTGQERPCAGIPHPATFPKQLAADHIATWSNPGDVVLDMFVGSGTTCVAAKELGRHSIGIDVNAGYISIASARCNEPEILSESPDYH